MGELTGLLDILIDLFTKRNERHNRALRDIMDLSRDIEEFLVKYNLQEKNSDFRLIPENIGQAKIEVITIAYKTRKRIKTAKDIKSKDLPPLLEEVHSDLEMVKRALFNPALGNAVLGEVISKLHKSFNQLINEASNIAAAEARKRERKEIEQQAKEQIKRKVEEAQQAKEAQKQAEQKAKLAPKEEKKRRIEEAQQAEDTEKRTVEEVAGAELYEGTVKLTVVSPVYLGQMRKLVEYLRQVQELRLEMIKGSLDEGTAIVVSAAKPIPLTDILREMPPVEQAFKKGNGIQIVLEAE